MDVLVISTLNSSSLLNTGGVHNGGAVVVVITLDHHPDEAQHYVITFVDWK